MASDFAYQEIRRSELDESHERFVESMRKRLYGDSYQQPPQKEVFKSYENPNVLTRNTVQNNNRTVRTPTPAVNRRQTL